MCRVRFRSTVITLLLAIFLAACVVASARSEAQSAVEGRRIRRPSAPLRGLLQTGYFLSFGIGYAVPNLADEYAPLGASWAKLVYADTRWNTIEPNPPVDGVHTYHWDELDALIAEYQGQGFTDIHLTLEAKSDWGSRAGCAIFSCKPSPPRPEYWADYLAYVRAVVERYDRDGGSEDMPGLLYPVQTLEIESEADNLWQGTVDEYLTLLQDAYQTVKDANPHAQVSPAAMYFYNLFSGQPDAAEIERRLNERPNVQAIVDFDREVLRHPELFDFVQFHGLGGYDEDEGTVAWLRDEMQANGYQKPVWLTDAVSGPPLIPMGYWGYLYDRERARHYLDVIKENIVAEEPSQEYRDIMAWYRAEQARFAVKRVLVAAGLDTFASLSTSLGPVLMGPLEDWPHMFCLPLPPTPNCPECPYNFYSWAIYGMYEIDHGPLLCFFTKRDPVAPYPIFYSLQLMLSKLTGTTDVERLDWGTDVHTYQVTAVGGQPSAVVLWYDDGVGQMVEEGEGRTELTFISPAQQITVTHIITQTGQTQPAVDIVPVVEGRVTLQVTETPIFVEGELTARCVARADLDCDCDVDVADISHVAVRWQSQEGDSDYERASDLNDDGQIDIVDVMAVAARWGAACLAL